MAGLVGKTTDPNEIGVLGESEQFEGVRGISHASFHGGVVGMNVNQEKDVDPGPGVYGHSLNKGKGVYGDSDQGTGVYGHSSDGTGVQGDTDKGIGVFGKSRDWIGVHGKSTNGDGVVGIGEGAAGVHGVIINEGRGAGVVGESKIGRGVVGTSTDNYGVSGDSQNFPGVRGTSIEGRGVEGWSSKGDGVWGISTTSASGVHGVNTALGAGVFGETVTGRGVYGISKTGTGVFGETHSHDFPAVVGIQLNEKSTGAGIYGEHRGGGPAGYFKSATGEAVHAENRSRSTAAMAAYQMNPDSKTPALFVKHMGNQCAGRFEGVVEVTIDVQLTNADCAEEFDIAGIETVESGTVMVLCDEGTLKPSEHAYDKRVAGVISGAGNYRPGIVLDKQPAQGNRSPVALLGKVFCKADASYAAIEVGDMLTTSSTPGYAMKAIDPLKAFGAVIGKALRPLKEGQGLIPILIALQ